MGKTYRKNNAWPDSVSLFGSDHNRGFSRKSKRHSRHSIRTKNQNINDESMFHTHTKHRLVQCYNIGKYKHLNNNIPNLHYHNINDLFSGDINMEDSIKNYNEKKKQDGKKTMEL